MGLDVYVGSLTRYFVEGPADAVDRVARHQGVTPDGQAPEEVIRSAVERWRAGLNQGLADRLDGPLDWDESGPAPCFTDKPGWDGYGGALLLAAHDEHPELPPPALVSADWPDDPAYQAASARGAGSRPLPPRRPAPGAGRRRPLAGGRRRQRSGRAAAAGRAVGGLPGAHEARLLGRVSPRTGCGRRTGRPGPRRPGGRGTSGRCGSAR
jgi:hypothetical protein